MNEPGTIRKIAGVVVGAIVVAVMATLIFLLMESIFESSIPRSGDKDEKYRLFSEKVAWSFYMALFIGGFAGALTAMAIARVRVFKLACITALIPLGVITLSLLFDGEGGSPDAQLVYMVVCLLGGATAAWYIKKEKSPPANDQYTNG